MKLSRATTYVAVLLAYNVAAAQSLDDIAAFADKICGDVPKGKMTRKEVSGKIKGEIAGVAKIVGVGVTADGKLDYGESEYVGIPYSNLPKEIPTVSQCKIEVVKLVSSLPKKKVISYKTCRHPDFGLASWGSEEDHTNSSGWRGGGYDENRFCNDVIAAFIQSRGIGPVHKVATLRSSQESKKDILGHVEYKYHCSIRVHWNPVYRELTDARCGIIES